MQFTAILLAFCVLVSSSPLLKRDAATVLSDISAISDAVSTLDSQVRCYNGTVEQSFNIFVAIQALETSLQTATNDTAASDEFDESDSEDIANAISTLTPDIIALLSDVDAQAPTVAPAGFTSGVESTLEILMGDADDFLTAVTDKVTEEQTGPVGTSADQLNYAFNQAISTY